ncbi:MAG TPA: hypothetical protein VMB73_00640 [Acetobacteraceae bacterium]|jgi:hypothetical protein|nr:hypothetical protein [Acetobacteraceae bacterium]
MGGGGSVLFTDVKEFEARLPGTVRLVLTNGAPFRARLTWLEVRDLLLVHAREAMPRVACLSLPANQVCAFFPIGRSSVLVCDGTEIRAGELVLYRDGGRAHQRILGSTRWSSVSLATTALHDIGITLTGRSIAAAPRTILRIMPTEWRHLLKSHSEAIRIAETRLPHIDHPEVARALEQELIWSLVNCLATAEAISQTAHIGPSDALTRFETCLAKHAAERPSISAICESIQVPERTLRALCSRVLGMSPARYQRLAARAPPDGEIRRTGNEK